MDEQRYEVKKDIARRIKLLHFIFIGVVLFFLIYIVVGIFCNRSLSHDFDKLRDNHLLTTQKDLAHRGSICSRNGDVLATSITRTAVRIDFGCDRFRKMGFDKYKKEAAELAKTLSECLGDKSTREYYDELIRNNKKFINYYTETKVRKAKRWKFWKKDKIDTLHKTSVNKGTRNLRIFRDLDANEWHIIKKAPLLNRGITYTTEEHDYRVYPQGNIALRTIGRLEHHRSYGIESAYRDTLAGHDGRQRMQRIAAGFKIRVDDKDNIEAQNGYDVITTLDIDVQDVADSALREQLIAQDAIWGTTIVMEVATGDILAMANLKRNGSTCVEEQNYAIGIPVNPGSTFKLVSAMALLEKGVPTSTKYHSGLGKRIEVGGSKGATVQDSHPIAKDSGGVIDMRRAFSESANVYFTKAVFDTFQANPVEFSDFCRKLHIHETVGLEELGARKKPLHHLDKRHHSRYNALVNMAYGYGLEITPLHTIAIYNAVANGGKMVAPRIILRTERDGKVVNEAPIRVIEDSICSQSTLKTLRSFMEEVSLTGTAAEYFGEKKCSFRTGSKTGTAQVDTEINGVRYTRNDGYYYGSMVTYLPAESPRYTVMTAIFTKRQPKKSYYGAGLAGPIQQKVATFLYNRDRTFAQEVENTELRYATNIKGGNIEKMRKVANEYSGKFSTDSRSGWGEFRSGKDGAKMHISQHKVAESNVPNVVGMGLNDALYLLENSGLKVDIVGRGKVVKQSLAAGTAVDNTNKQIKIELQ